VEAESRGREAEASTLQPSGKRETSAVVAKVTATAIAMAMGNTVRQYHGTWRRRYAYGDPRMQTGGDR